MPSQELFQAQPECSTAHHTALHEPLVCIIITFIIIRRQNGRQAPNVFLTVYLSPLYQGSTYGYHFLLRATRAPHRNNRPRVSRGTLATPARARYIQAGAQSGTYGITRTVSDGAKGSPFSANR